MSDKENMQNPNDEIKQETPEKKPNVLIRAGKTLLRWLKRMVLGASKELADEDIFAIEKLESPSKLAVKAFFRRKLAVVALVVLVALFLFVFVGSVFLPIDVNYIDPLQANKAPTMSMRSVPSALKKNIRDINGVSGFTVGVSNDNKVYVWGATKDSLTKLDFADIPDEIQGKVYMASAGSDYVLAITTDGKIVGWGNNTRGQYGQYTGESSAIVPMPEELLTNGVGDVSKVDQLTCGYQATALIIDGRLYMWGNSNSCNNMKDAVEGEYTNVKKAVLTNTAVLLLMEDGSVVCPGGMLNGESAASSSGSDVANVLRYLSGKKVTDITASNKCFAFLTDDGEILVQGPIEYNEDEIPAAPTGETYAKLVAGNRHFLALTDAGTVCGWGYNAYDQLDANGESAAYLYAGAQQTYLVNADGKLEDSYGQRGYLFGTDSLGRDTFTRIVHGGKMTMTIGAVAVIVSSIIAILVGCLSGYFGGWVDMFLMRVTEIFSAIPFLPFAMMLSYVIRTKPISETTRIFIIMVILGLLSWTGLARMIRGQVLAEREKEFVTAAKSMGVKESRIAFKHILPNVISVILVSMALDFAGCLLTESSLSYLGFGVQQPQPTWGNMLNGANNSIVIQNYWWQWLFPAIFLSIATISINIIGDTLRDVLDPKSSQEK